LTVMALFRRHARHLCNAERRFSSQVDAGNPYEVKPGAHKDTINILDTCYENSRSCSALSVFWGKAALRHEMSACDLSPRLPRPFATGRRGPFSERARPADITRGPRTGLGI
jgi:hypothetical protein